MTNNTKNSSDLRSILEKEKLNGTNFLDWHRNIRIVLRYERKEYVLDTPIPEEPEAGSSAAVRSAFNKHKEHSIDASCFMLSSMIPELQKQLENVGAYEMIGQLRTMFQEQARVERFDTVKAVLDSKLEEGKPVSPHVLKMISHFENIEKLGFPFSQELATDILLHSLPKSYDSFKMNYKMQGMEKTLYELHLMLKVAATSIKTFEPKHEVLMVKKGKGNKKQGKGKKIGAPKAKNAKNKKAQVVPKKGPQPDTKCFHCNGLGHWKRNCLKYKEDLKNGKVVSTSGTTKK